jgi:hypothetical protein
MHYCEHGANTEYAVAQLIDTLRYKSEGREFDS